MLWVRNGYVELTIILNHKNIQYMFTFPFLHTLPIIITNRKASFSDLDTFDWLLWVIDCVHPILRKEERFVVGSVWCHLQTWSKISLRTEFLTSEVPGLLAFLCCLNVHLHIQRDHPVRLCLWWGQQHLQMLFGGRAGQGLWKGTWLRLWDSGKNGPGAGCAWLEKARWLWPECCALLAWAWNEGRLMEKSCGEALRAKAVCVLKPWEVRAGAA